MATTLASRRDAAQCALGLEEGSAAPGEAGSLLAQAGHGLADAQREHEPAARFATSYLSALRAAAAVLVARGRPHRARRRPQSVWVLLESAAPELGDWAAYFAARSDRHAAAQAGRTSRVSPADATDLLEQAQRFLLLVRQLVSGRDARGHPTAEHDATRKTRVA